MLGFTTRSICQRKSLVGGTEAQGLTSSLPTLYRPISIVKRRPSFELGILW